MSEVFSFNGVDYTLPTPKGLIFQSVASAYQLCVRDERPIYDHGVRIGTEKALVADFGDDTAPVFHDSEGAYGPSGADYPQIRGHFINTLEQGTRKQWSDDERLLVEKKLLVTQNPADHWLHTKPPVGKPWPTYDAVPAADVAKLAAQLGLVAEASAYEKENKNRKTVIAALDESIAPAEEELAAI